MSFLPFANNSVYGQIAQQMWRKQFPGIPYIGMPGQQADPQQAQEQQRSPQLPQPVLMGGAQGAPNVAPQTPQAQEKPGFFGRLFQRMKDPAVQQGMMAFGAAATAPRQFGQSGWGQFTQALNAGSGTYNGMKAYQQALQRQMAQQDFENTIKMGELGAKQDTANAAKTTAGARVTDANSNATYRQTMGQVAQQNANTNTTNSETRKTEVQNRADTLKEQIRQFNEREKRLLKADEALNKYRQDSIEVQKQRNANQLALGATRNRLYEMHLELEKDKIQQGLTDNDRPIWNTAFNRATQIVMGDMDLQDLSAPEKASKTIELAKQFVDEYKASTGSGKAPTKMTGPVTPAEPATTPSNKPGNQPVTVKLPDGQFATFPNKETADQFAAKAGLTWRN